MPLQPVAALGALEAPDLVLGIREGFLEKVMIKF